LKNLKKQNTILSLVSSTILVCLSGCASVPPFDFALSKEVLTENPENIVAATNQASGDVPNGNVIWGGVIVSAHNLSDRTQLEVLSYPLSKDQRPKIKEKPTGRFLIQSEGYLELASFQQGRLITVLGTVQDVTQGTVGGTDYQYPTITSNEMHLWLGNEVSNSGYVFGIGQSEEG